MKKPKTYTELYFEVRRSWQMNPVTRVHDSKIKKDMKKQRRDAKKSCKSYLNDSLQDFLFVSEYCYSTIRLSMLSPIV